MKTKHLRLMQRAYVILFFCFMRSEEHTSELQSPS